MINDIAKVIGSLFSDIIELAKLSSCIDKIRPFIISNTKQIKQYNYGLGISKYSEDLLDMKDFCNNLDNNWNIIPFNNGVYDIQFGLFREHRMDDYISQTVGYDYDPNVCSVELDLFLNDIMPNADHLNYLLWTCSLFLDGSVPNDFLTFFVGTGGNGKSAFLKLLSKTFGDLGTSINSTLFTRPDSDPGAARSDLVSLKNKRAGFMTEIEKGTVNSSIVKRLCGNDYISCRELFGRQESFLLRTKFVVACNDIPQIQDGDDAIWRRIRILKFNTRFVLNPTKTNEKIADPKVLGFIDNDISWRQALMNRLVRGLDTNQLDVPLEFKSFRQVYMDKSNEFSNFLINNVRKAEKESKSVLRFRDILALYFDNDDAPKPGSKCYVKLFNLMIKHQELYYQNDGSIKYKQARIDGKPIMGWTGLRLI